MRVLLLMAGLLGAIGVVAGALSNHAFGDSASASRAALQLETAARYALWHTTPLIACAWLGTLALSKRSGAALRWIGYGFGLGAWLFCGSLIAVAFGDVQFLTRITPVGGSLLILAWMGLAGFAITGLPKRPFVGPFVDDEHSHTQGDR